MGVRVARKPLNSSLPAGKPHAPGDGIVRVGPLVNLPGLLRDLNCDPESVFAGAGFALKHFSDPDFEIPFVPGSKLLARCVTATGCEHLGVMLGERADPSSLGVAGFMLRSAPDVRTALQGLVSNLDLHDRGAVLSLVSSGPETCLSYTIHLLKVEATDQIYDLSMTIACKIMRSLCGSNWKPAEVLFSRQPPRNLAAYRRFFRAPVRFNADNNALVFETRWLEQPLEGADPLLHRHLEAEAQALHTLQETTFLADFRTLLRLSLGTQKCSVKDISIQLGIHDRTLHRRLREEGTSFRKELEKLRYELAQVLLRDRRIPLAEIAASLDYADPAVFSRAFKQWSGITPSLWRTRNQQ